MEEQKFVDQYPQPPKHFAEVASTSIPPISDLHEEDIYNGKYAEKEKDNNYINKDVLKKYDIVNISVVSLLP